jgi:HNH endonuclease
MFGSVKEARHLLEGSASELDAERMLLPDVDAALEELGRSKRLIDGMIGKLARRKGDAKAVARELHVPTGEVRAAVETAELLAEFPETDAAVRRGELSAREAQLIAGAAIANPDAESQLLEVASRGLVPLKDACVAARAAVEKPDERRKRLHKQRHFRIGTDTEGMVAGSFRLTPEIGGQIKAKFDAAVQKIFRENKSSEHEPHEAYAADAFASFVLDGAGGKPKTTVHVVIDHGALMRGGPVEGERCEIPGVGPVDVSWVKEILGESFLTAVIKKGKDIATVAHLGRHVPAEVMTVLIVNGRECCVEGCHNRGYLEIDHRHEYAKGGPTSYANLGYFCSGDHEKKTKGWIVGEPDPITGKRTLTPPPDRGG